MPYTVIIKRSAQKQIEKLPAQILRRVRAAILALTEQPRPAEPVPIFRKSNQICFLADD